MHLEFLLEEASAEAAMQELLPKLLHPDTTYALHPHGGKKDLLGKLPARLRGYARWIRQDWRIVVLIDEDRQNCHLLKQQMERIAIEAGMSTKTRPRADGSFAVVNRMAVEELEAWFLGDPQAVCSAYPRVPASFAKRRRLRDPDAVRGGTWETLQHILQRAGYCCGGYSKIEGARQIARHMEPDQNRSRSFAVFVDGLRACEVL